ncbi:DUF5318 family protein [Sphaerisporangium siamense]|nr:DUF5318 family protein [Sphaerisporangium siamense]
MCCTDVSARYIPRIRPVGIVCNRRNRQPDGRNSEKSRSLTLMWSQRGVVDYGLAKRATLQSLRSGRMTRRDVCDAHPYLLRAARYHGEPTKRVCPICEHRNVTHVTYVYGDQLGRVTGHVKATSDLVQMAHEYEEFRVYVVEVCQGCSWNHLTVSFVLGNGGPPGGSGVDGRIPET